MSEIIDLGFCPRCKEDTKTIKTRTKSGVLFCWLCSFDMEDEGSVRRWVAWAKEYYREMMPEDDQS